MATGTAKTASPPPASKADRFIEEQLGKTRLQVRIVDLVSSLMALAAAVLTYLIVLAVVDHWLFAFTWWGRWLAFLLLVGGTGYYFAVHVVPLMLRPINPVYAARAIEEAEPSLKNSLINFILFRQDRQAVHEVVYSALEQRAATDLNHVAVDQAVDRSKVIYVGYVLAGVLVIGAAYKVLSPKDPFQSASRMAAPWADIQRPSRVQISDVQPGDANVFQGESVSVSAIVQGSADAVTLFYSTADGELDEQPVELKLDGTGLRYECTLPPDEDGLQQEVLYRIEAGDTRTATYRLQVSPAPNIIVERLVYDFPDYTKRSDRTITGQGDVKALESTRVTIRAKANQPIRSAYIELDPKAGATNGESQRLPMEFSGQEAWRTIVLRLEADRRTSTHASYQVRFVTETGRENQQPILHQIEVTPDLAPEIEVLSPTRKVVEVPQNSVQLIEVRAIDPDFGLTRIQLRAVAGGTELLDERLFEDQAGAVGQTVKTYGFRPARFELEPGDRVVYRASAEDNRVEPGSASPAPNRARTKDYQLLIVPPEEGGGAGADAQPDKRTPEDPSSESDEKPSGDEETPANSDEADPKSNDSASEESDSATGKEEAGGGADEKEAGGSEQGAQGGTTGQESGDQNANGKTDSGQPQPGKNNGGAQAGGDSPQEDGQGGQPDSGGQPGESEPLHDGEVFEKALERLKQRLKEGGHNGKGRSKSSEPQDDPGDKRDVDSTVGNDGSPQGSSTGDSGNSRSDPKLQNGDEKMSSKDQAEDAESPREGARNQDENLGAGAQRQAAPGEGAINKQEDKPTGKNGAETDRGEDPQPPGPKDMRKKDAGSGDTGDAGAGENSEDTSGTGAMETGKEGANRDRPKTQQPDSTRPKPSEPPTGGTDSDKQSDSKGESNGDKSGGGTKGRGQGANQAGNDSAGQNSAADEGAGKATEAGQGETSSAAGQKERAEGETGISGNEKGDGSGVRSDPSGSTNDRGKKQPQALDQEHKADPSTEKQTETSDTGPKPGGSGVSTGGGLPADVDTPSGLDKFLDVPPGDEANLEYARRATDLVLENLKDQQDGPNRELLDDLGWTEKELADFIKRWQQLKRAAAEDKVGERELNETLRSLGLRPSRDRVRQGTTKDDAVRGLRDAGSRSAPPPGYEDLINAFKKGAARSSN
jgi:hypothetical protein